MIQAIKTYSPHILFIFHFLGVLLFLYNPQSAQLSFLTIILCGVLIILHEKEKGNYLVYLAIALAGYTVEVIGVNTQYLFGAYSYGNSLGFELFNVPPLIGLNWLVIVISGASIARRLFQKQALWFTALVSSVICTLLDIIIEPVAIKFNFWQWDSGSIPIYNYVCWLILSFFFSLFYLKFRTHTNKIGAYVYGFWVLFFSILNFI